MFVFDARFWMFDSMFCGLWQVGLGEVASKLVLTSKKHVAARAKRPPSHLARQNPEYKAELRSEYCLVYASHLISTHLTSYHLTSCHLISSHLTSSHLISSHHISSPLMSSHLISSHPITSRLTSCHLISYHLVSSYLVSRHLISLRVYCGFIACACGPRRKREAQGRNAVGTARLTPK